MSIRKIIEDYTITVNPLPAGQLHALQPSKGGVRRLYGGTRSEGFKRGSYIKHPKYGVCYVGGASKGCISLSL